LKRFVDRRQRAFRIFRRPPVIYLLQYRRFFMSVFDEKLFSG
jgi:hypothetical protein